jgi:hypothetical protein
MIEIQKLRMLKLWFEDPTPIRGGAGNCTLAMMENGGLKGEFQVDVTRKNATKVLGKDADLTTNQVLSVNQLPDDIKIELFNIFNKIGKLL